MAYIFVFVVAFATLCAVAWRKYSVHLITLNFLILLTGVWIWANLRPTDLQKDWGEDTPDGLDPITSAMFWHGWPLVPAMICQIRHMTFRPSGLEGLVLVFDWFLFWLALSLTRFVGERCLSLMSKSKRPNGNDLNSTPIQPDPARESS